MYISQSLQYIGLMDAPVSAPGLSSSFKVTGFGGLDRHFDVLWFVLLVGFRA